jgi:hypothetical protein
VHSMTFSPALSMTFSPALSTQAICGTTRHWPAVRAVTMPEAMIQGQAIAYRLRRPTSTNVAQNPPPF